MHRKRQYRGLLRPHLYPAIRVRLGQWLSSRGLASAVIDTSDGLSTDLSHLCEASSVGAVVYAERVPLPRVPAELQKRGINPLRLALHGGEDYELLFTVPSRLEKRIPRSVAGVSLTPIGIITRQHRVRIEKAGSVKTLIPFGWDPFRGR